MVPTTPPQEIETEIVRKNNHGLFIVRDLKSDKQYPFMDHKLDEYYRPDFDARRATFRVGTRVIITVQNDMVTKARRA